MIIVIVGILAVVTIPRFEVFYDIKLQGAAKKLLSDIRYIQNVALSRHTNTRIIFDETNEIYQASQCESSCTVSSNWTAISDPFTRSDLIMDFRTDPQYGGVDISGVDFEGTATLRFNWEGTPQDANGSDLTSPGSVTLTLRGRTKAIRVTPQTGKVTVE